MSASATFDAGHSIEGIEREIRNHGHQWVVRASVTGDPNPDTGWPRGAERLPEDVAEIAGELHLRNLNEMMPGVTTSALGIAAQFLERLVLVHPRLSEIRVTCSDGTEGRITRTPR